MCTQAHRCLMILMMLLPELCAFTFANDLFGHLVDEFFRIEIFVCCDFLAGLGVLIHTQHHKLQAK